MVPLAAGDRLSGLLAVGERPVGRALRGGGPRLRRSARAAGPGGARGRARCTGCALEKERQDRELQIAREIQQQPLPEDLAAGRRASRWPRESRSCYQVGGDYYDFIPLDGGRLALVIADVSGKGTPASLLMASVHAWLRATAGTAPPSQVLERLNRFLYASTQDEPVRHPVLRRARPGSRRRLVYVNAGHVPPYLVARTGARSSACAAGGPVLGLLEEVDARGGRGRRSAPGTSWRW